MEGECFVLYFVRSPCPPPSPSCLWGVPDPSALVQPSLFPRGSTPPKPCPPRPPPAAAATMISPPNPAPPPPPCYAASWTWQSLSSKPAWRPWLLLSWRRPRLRCRQSLQTRGRRGGRVGGCTGGAGGEGSGEHGWKQWHPL